MCIDSIWLWTWKGRVSIWVEHCLHLNTHEHIWTHEGCGLPLSGHSSSDYEIDVLNWFWKRPSNELCGWLEISTGFHLFQPQNHFVHHVGSQHRKNLKVPLVYFTYRENYFKKSVLNLLSELCNWLPSYSWRFGVQSPLDGSLPHSEQKKRRVLHKSYYRSLKTVGICWAQYSKADREVIAVVQFRRLPQFHLLEMVGFGQHLSCWAKN